MSRVVMDGNTAASYISYAFTDVAGIYPITPSSPMAEYVDEWSVMGKKNIFGNVPRVVEMQSEGGASGTVHGSLAAGAFTATYTASQGLLLMIPNMYKLAGELLPCVFHVSARTLSVHALSIFGDHSDVMACRQTGFAMLASSNAQEVMDLGAVAHLSTIKGSIPFLHFFDGFRTSHEMQTIKALDYEDLKKIVDMGAVQKFRDRALNPEKPFTRGTTQNPDIFFQVREACNPFYNNLPGVVESYMAEINRLTGKDYKLFEYFGDSNATRVIVAMGSVCDTIKETVNYLNQNGGAVGAVIVRLYRPFSEKHFFDILPQKAKKIAVLDRTKEPGALGEPLYQDVCTAFFSRGGETPLIVGGRYGLASKDTTPAQIIAVFNNLTSESPKNHFTIGIEDDVTFLSLRMEDVSNVDTNECINCKIWGLGSDGTVGANKNTVKIIGETTDLYAQAYFVYDSKKSGGLTQSHLRFSTTPILSTYLVSKANFVACHNPSYLIKYDILKDLKNNGVFLLNCKWTEDNLNANLPDSVKNYIASHQIRFYIIDAFKIAKQLGLGSRINTILQSAFFKLLDLIPFEDAKAQMEKAIEKTYYRKGEKVISMNVKAIDEGVKNLIKVNVPAHWLDCGADTVCDENHPDFIKNVVIPMNRQEGDGLPVSTFLGIEDGSFPNGTSAFEKRGAAVDVCVWNPDNCIQCNQCAYVCPHAAIRPFLLTDDEKQCAPESFLFKQANGRDLNKYGYRMQVSPLDCMGCVSCVNVCPAKEKALSMEAIDTQLHENENWKFALTLSEKPDTISRDTVKGSQFARPLFEFSGACAGCGETPYIKLLTQLFGENMYIANASGCSSAYGGSTPSTPYTVNQAGCGPAWAMSLFEDNAEFAYGMMVGSEKIRETLAIKIKSLFSLGVARFAATSYLENKDTPKSRECANALLTALKSHVSKSKEEGDLIDYIVKNEKYLSKKSYWAFGGDGWAYDIGYGGLDHVLALGENINIVVFDTEVYSNTGGQTSKATSIGAIARFSSAGKMTKKKDLGIMAMSYGYIYVAQVAMGADQKQLLKAFVEAESYPGPSLIIAYSPCIEHGIKAGMSCNQMEMKKAVDAGYWHLYRYNPLLIKEGKNPFILDSKPPTGDLKAFLKGEGRYASLELIFPEKAKELFQAAENNAKERYKTYRRLAEND